MNDLIKSLAEEASGTKKYVPPVWQFFDDELENFSKALVKDVLISFLRALHEHNVDESNNPSFYKALIDVEYKFGVSV